MAIDLAVMKARLEAKRAELRNSIAALTEAHPQPADPEDASEGTEDFEEAAVDVNEMEDEQSILVNEHSLLSLVEQALQRIEQGTYGYCTSCGKPVGEKRLEAIPWAARDIVCEEQFEQQNMALNNEE